MLKLLWILGVGFLVGCTTKQPEKIERLPPPPLPLARTELPARPAAAPLIVLDAGHGGHDDGARCLTPPYPEKRATLQLAQLLQKRLTALGYRVALTRCQDLFLSLHERASLANQRGASAFVSLHFNHCSNATARGVEVFYCANDPMLKRDLLSKQLADSVLKNMVESTSAKERGVKEANFVVIRTTRMPSVLIEGGFLSNQDEGRSIAELAYLERLAQGIAAGIHRYFIAIPDADAPMSVYGEVAGPKNPSPLAKAKKLGSQPAAPAASFAAASSPAGKKTAPGKHAKAKTGATKAATPSKKAAPVKPVATLLGGAPRDC
jgi:N-acetylmuramoyl-L-alanine amidase